MNEIQDRQTDQQTDRQTDRRTDRQTEEQTDGQAVGQADRPIELLTAAKNKIGPRPLPSK